MIYLMPLLIGGIVGSAIGSIVFYVLRKYVSWLRGHDRLRGMSACISAVLSGAGGLLVARLLLGWVASLPRDTNDTGTAFGLLVMFLILIAGSMGVGAAVGTGLWQSTSLRGDEPTDDR